MKKIIFWIACVVAVFSCGVISGIFLNEKFGAPSSVINFDRVKIKGSPGASTEVMVTPPVMTPDTLTRRERRQNRRERRKAERDLQK